ncbi:MULTISPECIES: IMPACT family protein [unclassified Campylobacter]|uniref:IMPACT family protein n=1 Tax=unclassified Campylobacter TaxID=2593542 RepID=UPI0012380B4E|nr:MULTISPECIES: YigZ family protein [unclassified Campylobacter]KAA6226431.1 YigZ family protein [Campylobacter sp. LR286c]KAA6226531.1 YigZ family protein [Campylobacter sp. LR185c]KAA6226919.1 YigZ family protein [Campylobacter sp. LR196d]KAA6233663.1 YigZ family protein [Campylobacter sp. LR291e]KAA6233883.1 YigZ family protein [Campylobacter sp. LR264d]
MKIINECFTSRLEIKKSIFLAFLCPFKDFKNMLERLKNEHPKALHFVWAYRKFNENKQLIENKNDDKEPKGSSAMPCLNALRGINLVECGVIVVRYFGGIKLGVGGLVRAYSDATNLAIANAKLLDFEFKEKLQLCLDIGLLSKMEYFLKDKKIEFEKEFNEKKVLLTIYFTNLQKESLFAFCSKFSPQQLKNENES